MKNVVVVLMVVALTFALTVGVSAQNKYVGVKTCSMCHKATTGDQFGKWQKSKHAGAFTALKSPKAEEIAKAKGLKKPAAESPECLECHTITAEAAMLDKSFSAADGVQCEVCHGPGSAYKAMPVMKDKAKAIAAGLTEYKDAAAIEAKCKTCHNEKSPTKKAFDFKTAWESIKHPVPKKG